MPKPRDLLGLRPRYEYARSGANVVVTVTPPRPFASSGQVHVSLTDDQFARFLKWLEGGPLIQDILWDLTAYQRELLLTGFED